MTPVSVYIAARFSQRAQLSQVVALPLIKAGFAITSRWLELPEDSSPLGPDEVQQHPQLAAVHAQECLEDIEVADRVVLFTDHPSSTGGFHVELGFALRSGKEVYVVGPPLNIFMMLPSVTRYADVGTFLQAWNCAPLA